MIRYPSIPNVFERDPVTHKYDLTQWSQPEFGELAQIRWIVTEKVDGTNIRVIWDGEKIEVRGRSNAAQVPKPLHARLLYDLKPEVVRCAVKSLYEYVTPERPLCIYGEGYGAGIQKGGTYSFDQRFRAFDARLGNTWLPMEAFYKVCTALNILLVPGFDEWTLTETIDLVKNGWASCLRDGLVEGVVVRPTLELCDRRGNRIIGKIKTADFARNE